MKTKRELKTEAQDALFGRLYGAYEAMAFDDAMCDGVSPEDMPEFKRQVTIQLNRLAKTIGFERLVNTVPINGCDID